MPYKINGQQFANALLLEAKDRFTHFVDKVVDWEELWTLSSEEFLYIRKVSDTCEYLPVWPHPIYAQAWNTAIAGQFNIKRVNLDVFLDSWLPIFSADGTDIGVFPDMEGTAWIINPVDLVVILKSEVLNFDKAELGS